MDEDLAQLREEIEVLKRRLLEAILAELEAHLRLREAKEQIRPLRLTTAGDPECGVLAPAQPSRRARR